MSLRFPRLVLLAAVVPCLCLVSCNKDDATAPAIGTGLDSPFLLGATTGSANYIHAFGDEGNYSYHCRLHTTAQHREGGMVLVKATGPESAFVSIFEGKFHPETTSVRLNGQVRWQNFDDGTNHTITSD